MISKDKATIARILNDNGYDHRWFGKNHNTPAFQVSQTGPFDQWPTGMGFDYFYGFIGGDTSAVAARAAVAQHHADLSLRRPPRVQPRSPRWPTTRSTRCTGSTR